MRLCTGALLPKHLNNYVTVLKTALQHPKQRDCDLMIGKPLKKPSRKGNRVCSRLNSGRKKFAWQFLQLAFDLFLDSKATLSWLKDERGEGSNRLDVKYRSHSGCAVMRDGCADAPHCKQVSLQNQSRS